MKQTEERKVIAIRTAFIMLAFFVPLHLLAQTNDTIDSVDSSSILTDMLQEDYISVSLMVASPDPAVYSAAGHASLRMECESKQIDYCYEFDTEVNISEMIDYINGDMKASLFRHYTETYNHHFKELKRGITAIRLNLKPVQKVELWRMLDEDVDAKNRRKFDFMNQNCCSVARMFVEASLETDYIRYNDPSPQLTGSYREAIPYAFAESPWAEFFWNIMMGNDFDTTPDLGQKLFPKALFEEWKKATIVSEDGTERPMVKEEYTIYAPDKEADYWKVSPLLIIILLLTLSLISSAAELKYGYSLMSRVTDVLLMSIETSIGLFLTYLLLFSHQIATSWNWLIIVFSPLPLILWIIMRKSQMMVKVYSLFSLVLMAYIILTPLIPQMQYGHLWILILSFAIRTSANCYINNNSN